MTRPINSMQHIKTMMAVIICLFAALAPGKADAISFDFEPEGVVTSGDMTDLLDVHATYPKLTDDLYKPLGKPFLIQKIPLKGKSDSAIYLVCAAVTKSNRLKDIRLVSVRESTDRLEVVQQIKVGDGEVPHILTPDLRELDQDFMLRIIRGGANTEAYLYEYDQASAKIKMLFKIDRSFTGKIKVPVKGTMLDDGMVEIEVSEPAKKVNVDMRPAVEALIEDELYQPNGKPIPALRLLTCTRMGWEGEDMVIVDGVAKAKIGLTMITNSRKQVINVMAIMTKIDSKWVIEDYEFEPFWPYRWE